MAIQSLCVIPIRSYYEEAKDGEDLPFRSTYTQAPCEKSSSYTSLRVFHVLCSFVRLKRQSCKGICEPSHGPDEPCRVLPCKNSSSGAIAVSQRRLMIADYTIAPVARAEQLEGVQGCRWLRF